MIFGLRSVLPILSERSPLISARNAWKLVICLDLLLGSLLSAEGVTPCCLLLISGRFDWRVSQSEELKTTSTCREHIAKYALAWQDLCPSQVRVCLVQELLVTVLLSALFLDPR